MKRFGSEAVLIAWLVLLVIVAACAWVAYREVGYERNARQGDRELREAWGNDFHNDLHAPMETTGRHRA